MWMRLIFSSGVFKNACMKSVHALFFFVLITAGLVRAESSIAGGRVQDKPVYVDLYGGIGQVTSLSGSVSEVQNGSLISGGLNVDLKDLGIEDGSETTMFGGSITWKWVTLLVDVRNNTVEASGTADSELRLNVDNLEFNGVNLEYLLLPVGTDFNIDAESNWIGAGLRITPFTLNPEGRVRFTPWLHLGAQFVDTSYTIDSGNTLRLDIPGFGERVFAVGGTATGEAQLLIPEYGIGAEVRFRFFDPGERGMELVAAGTYKILQFDGSLDSIGFDDADFENLTIDYTALELGLDLYAPLGQGITVRAGVFLEQVDGAVDLDSKPSVGDFQRELDGDYTLTGFRAGIRF